LISVSTLRTVTNVWSFHTREQQRFAAEDEPGFERST